MHREHFVFLAEDREDDAELVRWAFNKIAAVTLEVAVDGEQARAWLADTVERYERCEARLPALVLLDLKLTKVSGFEILRQIRAEPILRRIPVVVFSTSEDADETGLAYDLGANAYVRKPETHEELLRVLRNVFEFWLSTARIAAPPRPAREA